MESLVVFGGGFLVALSSSAAKDVETCVLITAEVACRNIVDVFNFVKSSVTTGCAKLS